MRPVSIAFLAALCCSFLAAHAAGAAQQPDGTLFPEDTALAAPVTISARGQTLDDLLRGLHEEGFPLLEPARDAQWERVTLFTAKRPLRELMSGLSRLLNYLWEKRTTPESTAGYRFAPTIRVRQYERKLSQETVERAAAPLFRLTSYLGTVPEEYRRLWKESLQASGKKPDDPLLGSDNLYHLSLPESHAALQLWTALSPDQRFDLLMDERCFLPWSAMDARQRQLAEQMARNIGESDHQARKGETPKDFADWLKQFGLVLYVSRQSLTGAMTGYSFGLGGAKHIVASLNGSSGAQDLLPVRGNPYGREPKTQPPVYADLERMPFPPEFKLDPAKPQKWSDVLEELSKHLPLPLFSDDFTFISGPRERGGEDLPVVAKRNLPEALDALCKRYHYLWWYEEGALFFRSRTWFIERLYEVPPPILALLRKQLESKGRLDTYALNSLSKLTRRQLQGLNAMGVIDQGAPKLHDPNPDAYSRLRRSGDGLARGAYGCLQVYAELSATQKREALSPEGLPLGRMLPSQEQAFLQLFFVEMWSEMKSSALDNLRFRVEQRVKLEGPVSPENPQPRAVAYVSFKGIPAGIHVAYTPGKTRDGLAR